MSRRASDIRKQFIRFFQEKCGHTVVPSSPVVPHDDPTLLFTNAGMNQFKDVFVGTATRAYTRAVDSQKCIRAGGKHNDLDDVGADTYHHTFFEMLGNWSFGDYFKAEAIQWAWQLLTEVWGLDPKRLYVTVFAGDESDGLPPDTEAENLWKELTSIDPSHISRWDKKDNFWEMGDTGPCGPCTEIHYDFSPDFSGADKVNRDSEDVIEIWNLVFIQFNRSDDGVLTALPDRHVDTGMGFERICRVLQEKKSNYDIDLWVPIFEAIQTHSGARPYGGALEDPIDTAYRVIADHMRALVFAIADGATPGNDGRGYVLRRILRRAARFGRQTLGVSGPFLYHIVPAVVRAMLDAYPELAGESQRIANIILDEEESFGRTLDRGLELFAQAAQRSGQAKSISAEDAFKLHDTYGFPIDLTEQMARERGMDVDFIGYERLMEEAREKARSAATQSKVGSELKFGAEEAARLKHMGIQPTRDHDKFKTAPITGRVKAIWNGHDFDEHTHIDTISGFVAVITNRTNFYAEMGGQVGDTGRIINNSGGEFEVASTRAFGGYVLHVGRPTRGKLRVSESIELHVHKSARLPTMANHTATHLLNLALRQVLQKNADQKGSLVVADRMRFDFAHDEPLTTDQIRAVTNHVNRLIADRLKLHDQEVPLDQARAIHGLRAVFGEQYPDPVRVVSVGMPVDRLLDQPDDPKWAQCSIEFCGGTHVANTADIGPFAIIAEEAVAKGVRRIVAITGDAAQLAIDTVDQIAAQIHMLEGMPDDRLAMEVAAVTEAISDATIPLADRHDLNARLDVWQEKVRDLRKQSAKETKSLAIDQARRIAAGDVGPIVVELLSDANTDALRAAMDVIVATHPESAAMLLSTDLEQSKVAIFSRVPKPLIAKGLKAGDWVKHVAQICGGGGGGRPDSAQAGGKDPSKAPEAIIAAREYANRFVNG